MKRQTFYGASDDLVELEGDLISEEYPCDNAAFVLRSGTPPHEGGLRVQVYYGEDGTWFTAVAPLDDDCPFPVGFDCSVEADRYTSRLTIVVPADTVLRQVAGRRPDGEEMPV